MGIRGRLLTIVLAAVLPLPLFAFFFAGENLIAFVLAGLVAAFCAATAAILIARNVGGISATLTDYADESGKGNAFLFEEYTADALNRVVSRAVESHASADSPSPRGVYAACEAVRG